MRTWWQTSFVAVRAWLMAIAMPALALGFVGSLEWYNLKDFPKHLSIFWTLSLSRWVSYRAKMAILFCLRVLLILDHLSMKLRFAFGALALFMFSVAIVMFALFLCWWFAFVLPSEGCWAVALSTVCDSASCVLASPPCGGWGEIARVVCSCELCSFILGEDRESKVYQQEGLFYIQWAQKPLQCLAVLEWLWCNAWWSENNA